ncbi:hypothetical protein A3K72_01635 [Candidatus Woesearchaeota archaeon RBG_13_36_6]|nr:MAG: hypothetical protein A3K72_01635 [Candidatus Woesearchaeota archaeon RBG_13_36_6]
MARINIGAMFFGVLFVALRLLVVSFILMFVVLLADAIVFAIDFEEENIGAKKNDIPKKRKRKGK